MYVCMYVFMCSMYVATNSNIYMYVCIYIYILS